MNNDLGILRTPVHSLLLNAMSVNAIHKFLSRFKLTFSLHLCQYFQSSNHNIKILVALDLVALIHVTFHKAFFTQGAILVATLEPES